MNGFLLLCTAKDPASRGPSGLGRAARLCLVANCIDAEVRGGVGLFFPCVGDVGGRGGEFLVRKG